MKKNTISIIVLLLISLTFFWQVIFKDKILFPGDMLVGAYYPWLDYKWGTITGVSIKNPYITDIFSQIYLWKELITKSYLNGEWPLWNPYSYSGYPLLANFQSGALNIFNIIFIIFGMINGWNIFLITGILLQGFTMYLYLRVLKYSQFSSIIASFSFSFSGFSVLWMPYANANYSLASIPLALYFIEKYLNTSNKKYLYLISPVIFFMVTSGHFQIAIYGLILITTYLIINKIYNLSPIILGLVMSAIQLLPTFELSQLSIRYTEGFIKDNNFGLSPLIKLITLYIPDYYGNPTTYNYWGFFNYHETNFYVGVIGVVALLWSIFNFKTLKGTKIFLFFAIISLFMGFDTYIGKIIYYLNVPGISTSAAGRIASIFSLSTAILIANFLDNIQKQNVKNRILPGVIILVINVIIISVGILTLDQSRLTITLRNNIFPVILLTSIIFINIFLIKNKYFKIFIFIIVIFDLFRFGWKSTPFVSKNYIFPNTPLTDYLKNDTEIYRIEREYSPILPPNTWTHFSLSSPSGYDPLAINSYVIHYNKIVNKNDDPNPQVTRYLELFNFDPVALGEFNVKYLLMQKNYSDNKKTYRYNTKFNEKLWKKEFETDSYAMFINNNLKPRIQTIPSSNVNNIVYTPNIISLQIGSTNINTKLILRDTYFHGWQATVNEQIVKIEAFNDIYRQIDIPIGESKVIFTYSPQSFVNGLILTILSFITYIIIIFII